MGSSHRTNDAEGRLPFQQHVVVHVAVAHELRHRGNVVMAISNAPRVRHCQPVASHESCVPYSGATEREA